MWRTTSATISLLALVAFSMSARAQNARQVQPFGSDGRIYSVTKEGDLTREAYLLSQRSFEGEDGFSYEGNIKYMFKYQIGGYEIKLLMYRASCSDSNPSVQVWETNENESQPVAINDQPPLRADRESYNLYWALCYEKFNWFRPRTINRTYWNHNGSLLYVQAQGARRKFYFENPRKGLIEVGVGRDALAVDAVQKRNRYSGTAYVFSKICGAIGYAVTGTISGDRRSISLSGTAPWVDAQCQKVDFHDSTLLINFQDE